MKYLFLKGIAILLIAAQMTGCATMFGRQHNEQTVLFDSKIPDVEVTCSGKRIKTPGTIPLRQSETHSCVAEKEGYQRQAFKVRSGATWSGFAHSTAVNTALWGWWTWGVGTVIGWLIDAPSGAMKNLKKDHFDIELQMIE